MSDDACRLFLVTPVLDDAQSFLPQFEAALAHGNVACVLLRHSARDEGEAKKIIRTLAPVAQAHDAACLVEGDPRIAVRTDVDGVHIELGEDETSRETIAEALQQLKPNRIVGIGNLQTRDDAMLAGESGVDYLMFGGPESDETPESILERVGWWADIFNVPCVGFAHTLEQAGQLARAGADFVALSDALWNDPRGIEPTLAEIRHLLADTRETA